MIIEKGKTYRVIPHKDDPNWHYFSHKYGLVKALKQLDDIVLVLPFWSGHEDIYRTSELKKVE